MVILQPSILESQLTGWKYTLVDTFRRIEYSAKYQNGNVFLTRKGKPVSTVPDGLAKRFNAMSASLDSLGA